MALGFGNTGSVTFDSFAGMSTGSLPQSATGPGWTAATGDVTAIDAADDILRVKVVSGRHDPIPITVPIVFDPAHIAGGIAPDTNTNSGTLLMTYPPAEAFSMAAGMTAFKYGDMLDDDVMIGECEFMLIGGLVLADVYTV